MEDDSTFQLSSSSISTSPNKSDIQLPSPIAPRKRLLSDSLFVTPAKRSKSRREDSPASDTPINPEDENDLDQIEEDFEEPPINDNDEPESDNDERYEDLSGGHNRKKKF